MVCAHPKALALVEETAQEKNSQVSQDINP
jgi:hypothetical protein